MPGNQVEEPILEIRDRYPVAKHTIIFAPSLKWNSDMFQRPQQLARALAKCGALVFYLQPERVWPPVFTEIEKRLILCQASPDAFHVLSDAFVYVLTWNIPLLAYFPSSRVIYDYLDDLSTFSGDSQQLHRDHSNYIRKADIVMTTAERLFEEVIINRPESLLVPNGVDYAHFSQEAKGTPPSDLETILNEGKPIIGYHGALARWFDYELVKFIAQQRQDLSIVLIGADHDQTLDHSSLLDEINVHWLGAKPYQQLPDYISRFDLGFIPFVINKITNATSPIKLFEYFAAGKPTIITPMQESVRYTQALVANTEAEWLQKIDYALHISKDDLERQNLQQTGLQNTWEIRAKKILKRMDEVPRQNRRLLRVLRLEPKNPRLGKLVRLVMRGFKVLRMSGLRGFLKGVYFKFYDQFARLRRLPFLRIPLLLEDLYVPEDNSQVTLFTDQDDICPDYWPRNRLKSSKNLMQRAVTVISTCKNESDNAAQWISYLASQTLKPDEIIVVDAGSTDQTVEILETAAREKNLSIRVFKKEGVNIAAARNMAIQEAKSPIIASLDFGCIPHEDWLENLILPFQIEPKTEVVAGWYRALDSNERESHFQGWPALDDISPQDFIPSSRSLAFTKDAWEKTGGYPEWLTLTGEDTYFALELKRFCLNWAFAPEAIVDWVAPQTWTQMWRKTIYWATGDGEIGYKTQVYRYAFQKALLAGLIVIIGMAMTVIFLWFFATYEWWVGFWFLLVGWFLFWGDLAFYFWVKKRDAIYLLGMVGLRFSQGIGFLRGARRRKQVSVRRLKQTKGLFFLLAGVPIDDTGGGARSTQLALELLRQNFWVVYINRFPKYEAQVVNIKIGHPNLLTFDLETFEWNQFVQQFENVLPMLDKYAIVEFPVIDFLPMISKIKDAGGTVVYEMIDDWNSLLGGSWYLEEFERKIIEESDLLVATAPILKKKMEKLSNRTVKFLPNAVNNRLFSPERIYSRPNDLPYASWIAIYIGALWGDWFDWDLLRAIALRYPDAEVVVIGDYRNQCVNPPENLKFLGLKPQSDLPAYLAHSDVAIIPWKVNSITQATSPLKLYEYLAMHRPVVTPDLNPLRDIPGVFLAEDTEAFIRLVNEVRAEKLPVGDITTFIDRNNWQARVLYLLEWLTTKN